MLIAAGHCPRNTSEPGRLRSVNEQLLNRDLHSGEDSRLTAAPQTEEFCQVQYRRLPTTACRSTRL